MTRSLPRLTAAAVAGAAALAFSPTARAVNPTWIPATGDWFDPANWTGNAVPTSNDWAYIANGGTAQVNGGSAAVFQLRIGTDSFGLNGSGGAVEQSGGSVSGDGLYVGLDRSATYTLSDTGLVDFGNEYVGYNSASSGTVGRFIQAGGSNHAAGLTIGIQSFGPAPSTASSYEISAGTLTVDLFFDVGSQGLGRLAQTGGSVQAGANADVTVGGTYAGRYDLSAGTFAATALTISNDFPSAGQGTFAQSGGTSSVARLTIAGGGRYELSAGTLTAGSIINRGTIDFTGGAGTLNYSGIVDLTQGSVAGAAQANVVGSSGSLLLLPTGTDPATYLGALSSQGVVHVAGSPLTIPAGQNVAGNGTIADHVNVSGGGLAGTASGGQVTVTRGITVSAGGSADIRVLTIADANSGMTDGSLTAGTESINAGGTFTQSGGAHAAEALTVNPAGTLALGGGTFTSSGQFQGSGTFDFSEAGGGSGADLAITGGFANLADGTLVSTNALGVTLASNSVLIVPAGFDPATQFRAFSNTGGIVHAIGSALTIPSGTTIVGGGTIKDPLVVGGTVKTSVAANVLNLTTGVNVLAGGSVSTGSGSVTVNSLTSGVDAGGMLSTFNLAVGTTAAGSFTIKGSVTSTLTTVGTTAGATGVLTVDGGNHNINSLTINARGTYNLKSGTVAGPGSITLNGTLTQDGGALGNSFSHPSVASSGTYRINGGTATLGDVRSTAGEIDLAGGGFTADYLTTTAFGAAVPQINLTGGTHRVVNALDLSSGGSLTDSGGSMDVGSLRLSSSSKLRFVLDATNPLAPITWGTAGTSASIGGTLNVDLVNGSVGVPSPSDVFVLLRKSDTVSLALLSGSFSNVANGGRLSVTGGSFQVNYGSATFGRDKLVLSNFQAVPEPAGVTLLAGVAVAALARRRRR